MSGSSDDYNPFRPVWEDNDEESLGELPSSLRYRQPDPTPKISDESFIRELLSVEQALSRLDALVETSPEAIREGLLSRMAFREASGWLAQACQWVHPLDIALRSLGLTGSYIASAKAGSLKRDLPNTLSENPWNEDENTVVGDRAVTLAFSLVKTLRRLSFRSNKPLHDAESIQRAMLPLGWVIDDIQTLSVADWFYDYIEDTKKLPAIVAASNAAAVWRSIDNGFEDEVDLRAGYILAAAMSEKLRSIILPFWTARPVISGLQRSGSPFGKDKIREIIALIVESSVSTNRELKRLMGIYEHFHEVQKEFSKRSRLSDVFNVAMLHPIVTSKFLAKELEITPQAATRILLRMVDLGLIKETTGRKSFRAFSL